MRLAAFIESHLEAILAEWEAFARSLGRVTAAMSVEELRDHAKKMLLVIVDDMRDEQSAPEEEAKGKGHAPDSAFTAASAHGTGRHHDGFSLLQLSAEFRALRASVLRLWLASIEKPDRTSVDEIIRFNEAIDQAIAESVEMFSGEAGAARDAFLAMLGHDLRSPLHAIELTSDYFLREQVETPRRIASAKRIKRSVGTMSRMVNDLLEFSRAQLGGGIPIIRSSEDLAEICEMAVEEVRAAHPECTFELESPAEILGEFDADRLRQVFGNLLNNAFQYRSRGTVVTMRGSVSDNDAVVSVHNFGVEIPVGQQRAIFDPLVQLERPEGNIDRPRSSAGLGLFIARRIVEAHGGKLAVSSDSASGTTFTATLPR